MNLRLVSATPWLLFALLLALPQSVSAQPDDFGRGGRDRRGPGGFERMLRMFPVMKALDADEDGEISKEEIEGAAKALRTIDRDGNGNLTFNELEPEFGRGRRARDPRRGPTPNPRGMGGPPGPSGSMFPVMGALDLDEDGELFEDEITDAAEHLMRLDKNGDGKLSSDELRPETRGRDRRGGRRGSGPRGGGIPREGGPIMPEELEKKDGTATIPDRATFFELSYQGEEVLRDTQLVGLEYVKFQIEAANTDQPRLYFMNTKNHRAHPMFMQAMGFPEDWETQMRGVLVYRPTLISPSGNIGHYTFEFEPNDAYPYEKIRLAFDLMSEKSELLKGNMSYHLLPRAKVQYLTEPEKYTEGKIPVFEEADLFKNVAYLPLHEAESFGRLRILKLDERPNPREIVLCTALPPEMPRVAGIITTVRQTPLSHVNLRAVQDDVPNAFITDAIKKDSRVAKLIGKYVYYRVEKESYELREATAEEVEAHFSSLRPKEPQTPIRDLTVQAIRPLSAVGFADAKTVGVKAANVATLRTLGFREDLVPDGYAVPFHYYHEFMKHNGFYDTAKRMMADPKFQKDTDTRVKSLAAFRKAIESGSMPEWMMKSLADVQKVFPEGQSIRCRSSTNNEDLPGFSGAGLYDSYTHKKDEGHLSKSIKQVYASLWNFRAFEERQFFRIDHMTTAMGVLMHPNSKNELANGVAVTDDILYATRSTIGPRFYVNTQVGEDLVTNPETGATPEEVLISPRNPRTDKVIRRSSLSAKKPILASDHLLELRRALRAIEKKFRGLYQVPEGDEFAMEIEFKVTDSGKLLIKQARPWVQ